MRDVPISWGFFAELRNRFTLALRDPITIAAMGETLIAVDAASLRRRARGWGTFDQGFWRMLKKGSPLSSPSGLERGRRRTRQDQISLMS
jgi:hypothetical protein